MVQQAENGRQEFRVWLVLEGGGAKGLVHVGALRAIQAPDAPFSMMEERRMADRKLEASVGSEAENAREDLEAALKRFQDVLDQTRRENRDEMQNIAGQINYLRRTVSAIDDEKLRTSAEKMMYGD